MFLPWAATKWFTHDLRSDDGVASGSSYPQQLDGFAFGNLMFVPFDDCLRDFATCTATTERTNVNLQMLDTNVVLAGSTLSQKHLAT